MIVGRSAELEAIDAFLASSGGALLLEGELGAGKTALWREALARAPMRVLACRPAEAESSLAYAALGDLVGELALPPLPEPQRHALAVALLREEPRGPSSQRAVAMGLLGVLAAGPTLVAVDDVQWLDPATATVLAFVARRFDGWLLLARRGVGGGLPLGLEAARRIFVGPLDESALTRLLRVPRAEGARLHRESGGNAYYALELHARGEAPADLQALVGARLDALSPAGREAASLAAALSRPTTALVDAAAAPGVLEVAPSGGGAAGGGARVRFAHPLLATLAYERVGDKRALHARLAALVDDPEERARHLALAADGPDEVVARALDDAARRARARGAPDAAAALLEQARVLGPSWERDVEAAERHLEAGDAARAEALLEAALAQTDRRGYTLARLGWVRAHREGFRAAAETFTAALAEPDVDLPLEIEIEQGLSWCTHSIDTVAAAQVHARRALELAEALGDPTLLAFALSHLAFQESLTGGGMAMERIERALQLWARPRWTQILGRPDWVHALLLFWDGRLTEARDRLAALHAEALDRGDEHSLPFVLFQLARVELMLGDWKQAEVHAAQCAESVDASGQVGERAYALTIEAMVAAHLGHVERARERIAAGLELAEARGVQPAALEILATKGFLELSLGEPADATFTDLARRVEASGLKEPALFRWHGDAVEALVLAGRPEEVRQFYVPGRAWSARAAALLGEDAPAAPEDEPFEAARLLLVQGARARRNRQWRAAREQLKEARDAFAALGARLWVQRAEAESSRVGGRAADDGLTPTERQIAELIAAGRTYKEVADTLFISPKTVQWNLSKVYKKLGIKSRAELPARLIPATSPVSPAAEEP